MTYINIQTLTEVIRNNFVLLSPWFIAWKHLKVRGKLLKDNRFISGTVVAKGFVTCNGQIMTDSVFPRGFIGQFEGVLLTISTNADSIGPMVHYTASARYHTGLQCTTCRF